MSLDRIEDAIEELKSGRMIIVVDDEDRENEGDLIFPADTVNAEKITFMANHGKGLICTPITKNISEKLELPLMNPDGSDHHQTAFTLSVDAKNNISTGISSADRSFTIKCLADKRTKPSDLVRPGHIFPLIAKEGGVIERPGHTEAAVDLARIAGFNPVGVICEILNEDGTCSRLPDLEVFAKKWNLKIISIEQLIEYREKHGV